MGLLSSWMCGGRDQPAGRPGWSGGVPTGSRWVVGVYGPTAIPAGWRRGARWTGTGETGPRGQRSRGRCDGEGAEVCAPGGRGGVGCGDAAGAEGNGDAVEVLGARQEGRDGGVVRGVPVHGAGAAPRRPSAGVVVVGRAGPLQPRATVGINCGVSRFLARASSRGRTPPARRAPAPSLSPPARIG